MKLLKRLFIALPISILIWLMIVRVCFGAIYYVDSSVTDTHVASATPDFTTYNHLTFAETGGSDSVYKTMADVNAKSFAVDDFVLFRKGQIWLITTFTPASSGASGHPITFGAYGSGTVGPVIKGDTYSLNISWKSYLTFQNITFSDTVPLIDSSSNIIFNYCLLKNSSHEGLYVYSSPNVFMNNCVVANSIWSGVYTQGVTSSIQIRNSAIIGCGQPGFFGLYEEEGTINYDYCLIIGNNRLPSNNIYGGTDGGHNLVEFYPYFAHGYNQSYIVLSVDDLQSLGYVQNIVNILPSGMKISWTVNYTTNASWLSEIQSVFAAGHEIGNHTWSHSDLTLTTAFALTTTNANPTIDVDVATTTIALATTTGGNTVTYDWTTGNTITALKAAVAGKGWTITNTTNISNALQLSSLKDTAGPQAVPYSPLLDIVAPDYAFWRDEINDVQTWLTSIGITTTTIAYPYGTTNSNLIDYVKNNSFLGGRSGWNIVGYCLESVNIYTILTVDLSSIKGTGTEADVRKAANHMVTQVVYGGNIVALLAHNTTDFSIVQWGWFTDELNKLGANVKTFGEAIASIRADHSTTDQITYTKVYDDLNDFHLQSGSPAINAGVDVGLSQDYEGRPIRGLPDMGAYEFSRKKQKVIQSFGIMR